MQDFLSRRRFASTFAKSWTITDIGFKDDSDPDDTDLMLHRVGLHAGVVESVPAAFRAVTGNGVKVLAMGAFYVAPAMGGEEYKKNGFRINKLGDYPLKLEVKPED